MATLNFPTNPSLNQLYSFGGKTWIWNGYGWQLSPSGAINGIVIGNVTPATGGFTTVSATGNISGSYFIGNGSQLTGIVAEAGAAIVYGNSNVSIGGPNANVTVGVDGVANVAVFSDNQVDFAANLIPVANAVYSLGNITNQWKDIWVSNATIYLGNVPINMTSSNVMLVDGEPVLTNDGTQPFVTTGNISGNYFIGNGSALTSVMSDRGSDSNNWNTLTQMGVYTVNRVSWSGTVGTPLDSQVFVGLLEVKNSTDTAIEQVFYPGTVDESNAKIQWNRAYWSGSWTGWIKIVNDYQTIVGGEF